MDGKTMLRTLEGILNEVSTSAFLDTFLSYEFLDKAATDYVRETIGFSRNEGIITVVSQQEYSLPPDFLDFRIRDSKHRHVIRYYDNVNDQYFWPYLKSYDHVYTANRANITGNKNIPDYFAVTDSDIESQVTGTAQAGSGTLSGGECTLVGTSGKFSGVHARDTVHDTSSGYHGIVLEVETTSQLKVALFNDGVPVATASGSAFLIQPAAHKKMVFSDPSETAGHLIEARYYGLQDPVFSQYRIWPFRPSACYAICKKAAFEYKYRDRDPNFGDKLYVDFAREVYQTKIDIAKSTLQGLYGRGF